MTTISIKQISIVDLATDCIVNAANSRLAKGTGVCGAIFAAADSRKLEAACKKIGHCPTGSAVITPSFGLKARHIIHAVGPIWNGGGDNEAEALYNSYRSALDLARENGCRSIGFPLISTGVYGYPKDQAWERAIRACSDWIAANPDYEMDIIFAVMSPDVLKLGQQTLDAICPQGDTGGTAADGGFVFFWKLGQPNEELSNWYPCSFCLEGIEYNCVEQYMMAKKALLFGDITIYQKIMASSDPSECKDLGKLVRFFDSAVWNSCKREIVYNANYAKFHQNTRLMNKLLSTGTATLAEASSEDVVWGIGLVATDPDAKNPAKWRGENLLGGILEEIRDGARG